MIPAPARARETRRPARRRGCEPAGHGGVSLRRSAAAGAVAAAVLAGIGAAPGRAADALSLAAMAALFDGDLAERF
ncbi:MAG: hypothetical protein F4Z60_09485, partial [Chloroflexi bacterium]|nr:hypothetical protein [Chloroflexota bacterium]